MAPQHDTPVDAYAALTEQQQMFFLASLGFQLTLDKRGECYYLRTQEGEPQAQAIARLYALTEIHHQVDNQMMHLLRGDKERPGDKEYIAGLFRIADYHWGAGGAEWFGILVASAMESMAHHFGVT